MTMASWPKSSRGAPRAPMLKSNRSWRLTYNSGAPTPHPFMKNPNANPVTIPGGIPGLHQGGQQQCVRCRDCRATAWQKVTGALPAPSNCAPICFRLGSLSDRPRATRLGFGVNFRSAIGSPCGCQGWCSDEEIAETLRAVWAEGLQPWEYTPEEWERISCPPKLKSNRA